MPLLRSPWQRAGPVPTFDTVDLPSQEDRKKRLRFATGSWDTCNVLHWISLNPSGQKPSGSGLTGKRIFEFAWKWGFDAVAVYNLFPVETPNPKLIGGLINLRDGTMRANHQYIASELRGINEIIVAWGNPPGNLKARVRSSTLDLIDAINEADPSRVDGLAMWCLGHTKRGHPRHPSPLGRVPMTAIPVRWVPATTYDIGNTKPPRVPPSVPAP